MKYTSLDDFNKFYSLLKGKTKNLPPGLVLKVSKGLLLLFILLSFSSLVTRVLEFEFLSVPDGTTQRQNFSKTKAPRKNINDFKGSLQSNLFQVDRGSFNQSKIKQVVPQGNLKQILGNLNLKGFFSGFAIILDKNTKKEEIYTTGDTITGSGAQLALIVPTENYVNISLGEETAKLVLVESINTGMQTPSSNAAKGKATNRAVANATTVTSQGNDLYLRSEDLDKELNNFSQLLNQARVVPVFKDKKPMGYKIKAIDKGSLYEKLGLKNNDVIKKINGQEIDSPERAMSLFKILRNEKEIVLNFERNGAPSTLNYHIQ